jgi:hypothetical protein
LVTLEGTELLLAIHTSPEGSMAIATGPPTPPPVYPLAGEMGVPPLENLLTELR